MPTVGENRVRASFNPSESSLVDNLKGRSAELIDLCEGNKLQVNGETARLWALAATAYEEAAMWAVKAATSGK